MKIVIENSTKNFESYRAQRVKSLFNAEDGSSFKTEVDINIEDLDWGIGLIVGASGSGKTSIGKSFLGLIKYTICMRAGIAPNQLLTVYSRMAILIPPQEHWPP